jgi:hypothetical protein
LGALEPVETQKKRKYLMKTSLALRNANRFAARLKKLRQLRRKAKGVGTVDRHPLTLSERDLILRKTGRRCHICGGKIGRGEIWQADHILAHTYGGAHSIENYLPAHSICNNYRWFFGAEEFQWILKLGVWFRMQIERRDSLAMALAEKFVKHEQNRISRQRKRPEQSEESRSKITQQ